MRRRAEASWSDGGGMAAANIGPYGAGAMRFRSFPVVMVVLRGRGWWAQIGLGRSGMLTTLLEREGRPIRHRMRHVWRRPPRRRA